MKPTPPSRDAEKYELFYSPFLFVPATVLYIAAVGWAAFWMIAAVFGGHVLAVVIGATVAVVVVPMLLVSLKSMVHPWTHKGPVVVFDANGVTDVRKKHPFIPWSDIGVIKLGTGETAGFLGFEFRRPDRTREDPPRMGALGTILRRARSLSDWNVSLRLLDCRSGTALAAANRFHQRAVRQQVVARNRGTNHGWSGTL